MPLWGWWDTDALLIEKHACQDHGGEWMVPVLHFTLAKLMPKASTVFYNLSSCVFCHHWPIYLSPFDRNLCSLHLTVLWYIISVFYYIRMDKRSVWCFQDIRLGNKWWKNGVACLPLSWLVTFLDVLGCWKGQRRGPSSVFILPI